MQIETDTRTAPAYWASYLINGDASGLNDEETAQCEAWMEHLASDGWHITGCEDESYFSRYNDAQYFVPGRLLAGDVLEYQLYRRLR